MSTSLPKIYIYPKDGLVFEWQYFAECTRTQDIFTKELQKYPQVTNVEDADIAFFPLTLGTAFQHQRSPHIPLSSQPNLQYQWRMQWSHQIANESIRKKVKHFLLLSYVLYNIQLQWIPSDITILAYECEITMDILGTLGNFGCFNRIHVIPYFTSGQKKSIENKKFCCYVGNKDHAQHFRDTTKQLFCDLYNIDVYDPKEIIDYIELFSNYKYILVLRGDTPTRCGFYQAIQAGSIPIIYKHCLLHYKNLYGGRNLPPIEQMCVILPDDIKEGTSIQKIMEQVDEQKCLQFIQQFGPYLCYDFMIEGISAPVYHSINSLLPKSNKKEENIYVFIPPLPPKYNQDLLPCRISTRDLVTGNGTSQYELEWYIHNTIKNQFLITKCIERASFVFIPCYTFLSGWKDLQFSQSRIAELLAELVKLLPSWQRGDKPHILVYSDVCWPTDDFFLSRISLPPSTVLISLESLSSESMKSILLTEQKSLLCLTSPYIPGFAPQLHKKDKWFVTYIGRMRPPFVGIEPVTESTKNLKNFHFIEMEGWKSINETSFLEFVQEQYTQSTFSLQPYGDRGTRRGFYQSLLCGCIPVIFSNNKLDYQQHTSLPIDSIAIVLGKDVNMSQIIQHLKWMKPDYLHTLQTNILKSIDHYTFDDRGIPAMRLLKQIMK